MKLIKPIFLTAISIVMVYSCNSDKKEKKETQAKKEIHKTAPAMVQTNEQRGEYLVNSIGCADCHSPKIMGAHGPVPDPNRNLSGHPANEKDLPYDKAILNNYVLFSLGFTSAVGPWGTSYSANLTPDDTGIGTWTVDQFMTAIRKGKYKGQEGGRDLLPPMPWEVYKNLKDDDLIAIFAYLKTIKPIENVVPAPKPPMQSKTAQAMK